MKAAPDDPPSPDQQSTAREGFSSRLPWRNAGPGRARLAAVASGMAAGRGGGPGSKGRSGGRVGLDVDDHIRHAIREESAATLGRAGTVLQEAVAALADFDRDAAPDAYPTGFAARSAARRALLVAAAAALWHYVVQREAMGLTSHDAADQVYGVTPELWRLMGSAEVVCGP